MNYMGSKRKFAPTIASIINKYIIMNNITHFYDCCCGGANLTDKIMCDNITAIDLSPSLIALHKQAQKDFSKIPFEGSREYWDKAYSEWKEYIKNKEYQLKMPLYEIGAIEWYSSYARGGFPRGYAKATDKRDYFKEGRKAHYEQSLSANYQKINFIYDDYKNVKIPEEAVIYIDPPYKNTKTYGISPKFDYNTLYNWIKEKSKTNVIFISEQNLPEEFNEFIVWRNEIRRKVHSEHTTNAIETLWFIDRRKEK